MVDVGHGGAKDPVGDEISEGHVCGRVDCDVEGGCAASVNAAEASIAIHPEFDGAIKTSTTVDEETFGRGGIASLAEYGGYHPDRAQHCIMPAPLNKNRICLDHRGIWWAEIETKGRIDHSSMLLLRDSTIRHTRTVLNKIAKVLYPLPANNPTDIPVLPESARDPTRDINLVHGGEARQDAENTDAPAPCAVDRCRILLDLRFLITEDAAARGKKRSPPGWSG